MWTKLRNVVRGVAQFRQTQNHASSKNGAAIASTGGSRMGFLARLSSYRCVWLILFFFFLFPLPPSDASPESTDDLSHGSAHSSRDVNGDEHNEDAADSPSNTGTGSLLETALVF